jgi:hypothetical protein
MKTFGIILLVIGVFWVIIGLCLPTAADYGSTLNLGLLFNQFEQIVIGCFVALIGSVFIGTAPKKEA